MKLRAYFVCRGPLKQVVELPLTYQSDRGTVAVQEEGDSVTACVDVPVDASALRLAPERRSLSGEFDAPRIESSEDYRRAADLAHELVAAFAFLGDACLSLSARFGTIVVAQNDDDQAVLDRLGTYEVSPNATATVSMRSFDAGVFDESKLESLLSRKPGLLLYQEALLLDRPVAQFRELWRVVESAFGAQGKELIKALLDFEPTHALGFTEAELEDLQVLRGRASHAASRGGAAELRTVTRLVVAACPRLKCLVEQLILTKASWGAPTNKVERLAPLSGFVGRGSAVTIFQRGQ